MLSQPLSQLFLKTNPQSLRILPMYLILYSCLNSTFFHSCRCCPMWGVLLFQTQGPGDNHFLSLLPTLFKTVQAKVKALHKGCHPCPVIPYDWQFPESGYAMPCLRAPVCPVASAWHSLSPPPAWQSLSHPLRVKSLLPCNCRGPASPTQNWSLCWETSMSNTFRPVFPAITDNIICMWSCVSLPH